MKKSLLAFSISAALATPVFATNGIAPVGLGQSAKGTGGASTAYPQDTLVAGINPAGMVHLGNRMDFGLEIFAPDRGFEFMGVSYDGNDPEMFFIPEFGYNKMLSDNLSFGLSIFGNGGMNATYDMHPGIMGALMQAGLPQAQAAALSKAKIDLAQVFITPTWSFKVNENHSIGVSPVLAIQSFELINAAYGTFSSPGHEMSHGVGMRVGWMGKVSDSVTLGASIQSDIRMSRHDDYPAPHRIDIPANANIGAAFNVNPQLDILFDVQWINYSSAYPTGVSTTMGGFGWDDILVYKLGAVYKHSDDLTLRAGVNVGESPLPDQIPGLDDFVSTLVPATSKNHLTLGFTKELKEGMSLTGSYIHSFKEEHDPFGIFNSVMEQNAVGVSLNYKF